MEDLADFIRRNGEFRADEFELRRNVAALHFFRKRSEAREPFFQLGAFDKGAFPGFAVNPTFEDEVAHGAPNRGATEVVAAHQFVFGRQRVAGFVDAVRDVIAQDFF
jgi:hypothetical protein